MTQYPEAYLVKELDMDVVNISLITDYDAGLVSDVEPVTMEEVYRVFNANNEKLKKLLFTMIERIEL
jgi:5'-methylthioadenosine phosphorylase